jgi:hypothetical protein
MIFFLRLVLPFIAIGKVLPHAITMQQGSNPERALLLHTLAEEVNLLRQYEGMSIEEGKGTGKGKGSEQGKGKKGDDKRKCDGKGGMMTCDETSKKGMSKESKKDMKMEMKKGMGKGMSKDKSEFPSQSIFPSLCKLPLLYCFLQQPIIHFSQIFFQHRHRQQHLHHRNQQWHHRY